MYTPPPSPPTLRLRPRWWYRAAYAWAVAGIGWLIVSGRLASYFSSFKEPLGDPSQFARLYLTGVLWVVSLAPLLILAFELGRQHTGARRMNNSLLLGLKETWRVAWMDPRVDEMAQEFAKAPDDDPAIALFHGMIGAALPLGFFLWAIPSLRAGRGLIWISGAAVIFGITAYCRRRAAPYLRDDPGRWNMFRWDPLESTCRHASLSIL